MLFQSQYFNSFNEALSQKSFCSSLIQFNFSKPMLTAIGNEKAKSQSFSNNVAKKG